MDDFNTAAARAEAEGRREQTCPDCGRVEAGGSFCSKCGRLIHPDEWHPSPEALRARETARERR